MRRDGANIWPIAFGPAFVVVCARGGAWIIRPTNRVSAWVCSRWCSPRGVIAGGTGEVGVGQVGALLCAKNLEARVVGFQVLTAP